MTKLMQWLVFGVLFFSVWLSLVTKKISHNILDKYATLIFYFPFITAVSFSLYAATIVLWRVYTFNNCEEAAVELKREIEEAKVDLKSKGFKFDAEIS